MTGARPPRWLPVAVVAAALVGVVVAWWIFGMVAAG
jgi:hypothetical protein